MLQSEDEIPQHIHHPRYVRTYYYKRKILVFGKITNDPKIKDELFTYHLDTGIWEPFTTTYDVNVPEVVHGCVVGDNLWVLADASVYSLDLRTFHWKKCTVSGTPSHTITIMSYVSVYLLEI